MVTTGFTAGKMFCYSRWPAEETTRKLDVGRRMLEGGCFGLHQLVGFSPIGTNRIRCLICSKGSQDQRKRKPMHFLSMFADLLSMNGGSFSLLLVAAVAFVLFRR